MLYIANTFTLGMLKNSQGVFKYRTITLDEARDLVQNNAFVSCVGHQATAELLTTLLETEIYYNRIQISVAPNDQILVCQLLVRLEEGKILTLQEMNELYAQGKIAFILVDVLQ